MDTTLRAAVMPAPPETTDSRLVVEGRVATLTFDRHDVRNELTGTALTQDVVTIVDWINAVDDISVLIMTGAGSAFSAGGNIKDMVARRGSFGGDVHAVQRKYRLGIQRIALAMHRLEVPAIAAINGPAVGAGLDLACMCDLRLAADTARLGETFINVGIIPGDGGGWHLQRLIGYQRAAELTFTGRLITAEEARQLGIVLEVVEPDALMPRAQALAAILSAKPPQALRLSKRLMKSAQRMELAEHLELCAAFQGICHNSEDHIEALTAVVEKRAPLFTGQ